MTTDEITQLESEYEDRRRYQEVREEIEELNQTNKTDNENGTSRRI